MTRRFPILMYHGVAGADCDTVTSVTPARFEWQMAWLQRAGAHVLRLGEAVECLQHDRPLPPRALAITFDDGLRSIYDTAAPILARYGFPATVFLITDYCGRDNTWPGQPSQVRPEPLLSWAQVRELDRRGLEFGAHTASHPRLDLLSSEAARGQIMDSQHALQTQLGHEVSLFAYPYGRHTAAVAALVGEYYRAACTARPGLANLAHGPLLLDRIDVTYIASPRLFTQLFSPAFPAYLAVRRTLRRLGTRLLSRAWA